MTRLQLRLAQNANLSNLSEDYINTHHQKKLRVVETLLLLLKMRTSLKILF